MHFTSFCNYDQDLAEQRIDKENQDKNLCIVLYILGPTARWSPVFPHFLNRRVSINLGYWDWLWYPGLSPASGESRSSTTSSKGDLYISHFQGQLPATPTNNRLKVASRKQRLHWPTNFSFFVTGKFHYRI